MLVICFLFLKFKFVLKLNPDAPSIDFHNIGIKCMVGYTFSKYWNKVRYKFSED